MPSGNAAEQLTTLIVGCTPLAEKVAALAEEIAQLVGIAALDPDVGLAKSNYAHFREFGKRRPQDLYFTKDINDAMTHDWIGRRKPRILIQCGWSQIFSTATLALPTQYCIGIHPGPLPVGRGAAVINWKLIEGGGSWGNSLFVMEEKTDTGAILDFEPFSLEPRDDVCTAFWKVDRTALTMLRRTLPKIADGTCIPRVQDASHASRYRKRRPADGLIDPTWPAAKIADFVRALTRPYPGAFFNTEQGKLVAWQVERGPNHKGKVAGEVVSVEPGKGMLVAVGDGESLWLTLVRPPNDWECWCDKWALEQGIQAGRQLVVR